MYQTIIDMLVFSVYPEILDEFLESIRPTIAKFPNFNLRVETKEFGNVYANKFLQEVLQREHQVFGILNDDLWFVDGWLEDVLEKLKTYECVSPGYVETNKKEVFEKAVEATKNAEGVVELGYGASEIMNTSVFRRIGLFDEQFIWGCDDLDLFWRLKLNGRPSVTSKKITTAHQVGATRVKRISKWTNVSEESKIKFYNKHGYQSYRDIRRLFKNEHAYFTKYR